MPLLAGQRKGDVFASATLVPVATNFALQSTVETTNA